MVSATLPAKSRPHAWPTLLAFIASAWGFLLVANVLRAGVSYPNELREPLFLAVLPVAFAVAAWFGQRVAAAVAYVVYVGAALALGLGFGGPHLLVGVPLVTVALFLLFRRRGPAAARPTRST